MNRTRVESSNIASIGYDYPSQTLEVQFHSGGIYQYPGVSAATYEAFMDAPSKGKYFHAHIKPHYEHTHMGRKG